MEKIIPFFLYLTFVSGQFFSPDPSSPIFTEESNGIQQPWYLSRYTKLLVTAGSTYPIEYTDFSEVVDLENPEAKCQPLSALPEVMGDFGVGALFHEYYPLVCGPGYSLNHEHCYELKTQSALEIEKGYKEFPINDVRYGAASIKLQSHSLWITGGRDQSRNLLKTTEEVGYPGQGISGPELPVPVSDHCLVRLDRSRIMLIGGSGNENGTWIYDSNEKIWTRGPFLRQARIMPACGVVRDSVTRQDIVIVTLGHGHPHPLAMTTTEIWTPDNKQWTEGPEFQRRVDGAVAIETAQRKSLLVLTGCCSGLPPYEISCTNGTCQWTATALKLAMPRNHPVAMLIPDSLANCTSKN